MKPNFPKSLQNTLEAIFVMGLGFGWMIYSSTVNYLKIDHLSLRPETVQSSDFYFLSIFELVVLGIIVIVLRKRKWSISAFDFSFKFNMIGVGILLVLFRAILAISVKYIFDLDDAAPNTTIEANWLSSLMVIIVNSFFEEFLLVAYFFTRLKKWPVILLIVISAIIRMSFHTYQGLDALPSILIMSIIFGLYFSKTNKIWPLILAHAMGNTILFLNETYHWY